MWGSEVVVLLHAAAGGAVGAGGGQGKEEEGGGQDRELHLAVGFFTKSAALTGTGDLSECALLKLLRLGKSFLWRRLGHRTVCRKERGRKRTGFPIRRKRWSKKRRRRRETVQFLDGSKSNVEREYSIFHDACRKGTYRLFHVSCMSLCHMLHCHAASAEISGLCRTYSPLKP